MAQALQGLRYNLFQLQSPRTGQKVDLSRATTSIEYFEDILVPSISMKLEVTSTINIVSELLITGGEMVVIDAETGSGKFKFGKVDGNGDIEPGHDELYVYKVSAIDSQRQASKFTIHLVSAEYLINETSRCNFKFQPKTIDQLVKQILGPHVMNVDPDKVLDKNIEKTKNTYSFMGNMRKPFYTIQWLCPKSISKITPSSGENGQDGDTDAIAKGTSGFLFFQNKEGFNFRSIDGLISETKQYGDSSDDKDDNIEIHGTKEQPYEWRGMGAIDSNKFNANYQIINYITERNTDIRKALITGMYANQTQYYNVLTHEMTYYHYNLADEIQDRKLAGEPIDIKLPNVSKNGKETSRYMFRISDHGSLGVGEDGLEQSGGENAERTDVAKSLARYNLLFTQSLNISIPMNVNMKVGDIIRCRFPRQNSGKSKEQDGNLSGKYLIRALHHHVEPNLNVTYLKLIRDSYGFSEPKIAT